MSYNLLPPEEANALLARHEIRAEDIPPYGLIATEPGLAVLVFRKTDGQILVIDVTGQVPAQFYQTYPAEPYLPQILSRLNKDVLDILDPTGAGAAATLAAYEKLASLPKVVPTAITEVLVVISALWFGAQLLNEFTRTSQR